MERGRSTGTPQKKPELAGVAFGRRAAPANPEVKSKPPLPKPLQKIPAPTSKGALLPRPATKQAVEKKPLASRSMEKRNPITGEKVAVVQPKTGMFTDKPSDRILKAGDPFSKSSKSS